MVYMCQNNNNKENQCPKCNSNLIRGGAFGQMGWTTHVRICKICGHIWQWTINKIGTWSIDKQ